MLPELRHNTDKRVIRTKKAIKSALFKLLESKDISVITISELTSVANVNRRTFYTHYRSITDILDEIENDLVAALIDMLNNIDYGNYKESVEKLFMRFHCIITEEFNYYFRIMRLDTRAFLQSRLKRAFSTATETMLDALTAPLIYSKLTAAFIAGGLLAFYSEWFYSEERIPVEEAAKYVSRLAASCCHSTSE